MVELHLRPEDARLVYLAVAYHLGRPGSELDPVTKQPVEHGLAEVSRELQPQLRRATASITLSANQVTRLVSGMFGAITELKGYALLDVRSPEDGGGRKSTVAGFDGTLRHLFPEIEQDVENAMEIAEHMIMLKRRLDAHFAAAAPPETTTAAAEPPRRRWWPFKR